MLRQNYGFVRPPSDLDIAAPDNITLSRPSPSLDIDVPSLYILRPIYHWVGWTRLSLGELMRERGARPGGRCPPRPAPKITTEIEPTELTEKSRSALVSKGHTAVSLTI